jgi:hypothetical protein
VLACVYLKRLFNTRKWDYGDLILYNLVEGFGL